MTFTVYSSLNHPSLPSLLKMGPLVRVSIDRKVYSCLMFTRTRAHTYTQKTTVLTV